MKASEAIASAVAGRPALSARSCASRSRRRWPWWSTCSRRHRLGRNQRHPRHLSSATRPGLWSPGAARSRSHTKPEPCRKAGARISTPAFPPPRRNGRCNTQCRLRQGVCTGVASGFGNSAEADHEQHPGDDGSYDERGHDQARIALRLTGQLFKGFLGDVRPDLVCVKKCAIASTMPWLSDLPSRHFDVEARHTGDGECRRTRTPRLAAEMDLRGWSRTRLGRVRKPMLYPLSYEGGGGGTYAWTNPETPRSDSPPES